ncbi:MAG: SpoVG family protein [Candidatus Omnitrophica bacterium]|nr:SpoVG family protein [Candidatus Omnitrophota bacterium]
MTEKQILKVDRIHLLEGSGATKAFCSLLILDTFCVKGFRVVQGKEGLFVSMPREQGKDTKWHDTFFPVSSEMRKKLHELILESYAKHKEREDK